MIFIYENSGRILFTVDAPHEHVGYYEALYDNVVSLPNWASDTTHYIFEGDLVLIPESPGEGYTWDWDTKTWIFHAAEARTTLKTKVDAELQARLYLPFAGFDADRVARERMLSLVARLSRGSSLPPGWSGWRDASNVMHWASESASVVLANLIDLIDGIEEREHSLLLASWGHKDAIDLLTDPEDLLTYDITTGWPS